MTREVMQQALDALELHGKQYPHMVKGYCLDARTALREAIAQPDVPESCFGNMDKEAIAQPVQPEQAPVAWQWLDTANFRKKIPNNGESEYWRPLYASQPQLVTEKLCLWKNFVNGRPEYWAFDNAYPVNMDGGDPQTSGEPCGYALFKPSINGRTDVSDEQVLKRITANAQPEETK